MRSKNVWRTTLTAISLTALALLLWQTYRAGIRRGMSMVHPFADTVFVERIRPETVRTIIPQRVEIYRTETRVRVETVRVPVYLQRYGIIPENALEIESRRVRLRVWSPASSAWQVQTYSVPGARWRWSLSAVAGRWLPVEDRATYYGGIELAASYRHVGLGVRITTLGLGIETRIRLTGSER